MENIVFICVDCLRNDFIKSDHADTPFLDNFVDNSLYFSNMYSTTTTTTPSVASFMTGEYSEINGVNSLKNAELSEDIETLAERYRSSGHNTYAETVGPLVDETQLDRGFEEYNNREHQKELFTDWEEELIERVQKLRKPYFFYLHLWELHKPINVPEKFQDEKFGDTKYARSLSALDRKLEELIDQLPDKTTVVIHGDHGESITWRDNFIQRNLKRARTLLRYKLGINTRPLERFFNRIMARGSFKDHFIEDGHGENIFDFTTNVPLIINSPEVESGEVRSQVRQIDVYPTVLDIENIDYDRVTGKTLLSDNVRDRKAYIRACGSSLKTQQNWIRGIRHNNWKFFEYPGREWGDELYDLEDNSKELKHVEDRKKMKELREELPSEDMKDSEEMAIKDKLEELGYM